MRCRAHSSFALIAFTLAVATAPPILAGTEFTYQGQLTLQGSPVTATCSMQFRLFNGATGGALLNTIGPTNVVVTNGVFTTLLDFGENLGSGNRWLEISADCGTGLTQLMPRSQITTAPYAHFADQVANASIGEGQLRPDSVTSAKIVNGTLTTEDIADGTITANDIDQNYVQRRVITSCAAGSAISKIDALGSATCSFFPRLNHSHLGEQWIGTDPLKITVQDKPGSCCTSGIQIDTRDGNHGLFATANGSDTSGLRSSAIHGQGRDGGVAIHGVASGTNSLAGLFGGDVKISSDLEVRQQVSVGYLGDNTVVGCLAKYGCRNSILAYASVAASGTLRRQFGITTLTKPSAGRYVFDIDATPNSASDLVAIATPELDTPPTSAASLRIATVNIVDANTFEVYIVNGSSQMIDGDFLVFATGTDSP